MKITYIIYKRYKKMKEHCWDVYSEVRKLKISESRANEIEQIACKYMIPKCHVEEKIKEALEDKEKEIAALKAKVAEQEALLSNPNLQMERLIEKVVCEHLGLGDGHDPYSSDAVLYWDDQALGSVTIRSYSED